MKLRLAEISAATGARGELAGREGLVPRRVRTDSRLVEAGDLFVCLRGERFDGHAFAAEVASKGAVALVGDAPLDAATAKALGDVPYLLVPDALVALGALARRHRDHTCAKVAGVTGSAGKTTVKETLACILSAEGPTAKNALNLNNRIGLPMSMLEASGEERFWVMEAGVSEPGEMDALGAILNPDLAVVVNVGPAHLEGLGDVPGVARNKARLFAHLNAGGQGLVCVDYPELVEAAARHAVPIHGFSTQGARAPYQARYLGSAGAGKGRYALDIDGRRFELDLPWQGARFAENCIAAAGAAHLLGISAERIALALATVVPPTQRHERLTLGAFTLIDDTYNANPLSMAAGLEGALEAAVGGTLICVLGEMRELGAQAGEAHVALGVKIALAKPAAVFWRGGHGADISRGLEAQGYAGTFHLIDSAQEFLDCWRKTGLTGGVVLCKGSRSIRMEECVQALRKELQG